MRIDFHVHTFTEKMSKNRDVYFNGEPEFKLLYNTPKSTMVGVENIIRMMDDQHVDMSVICGFPWRNPDFARENNDHVIRAVQKYPDRLKGLCCVDAMDKNAAGEVERCIQAGLSGAGELAFYSSGIDAFCLDCLDPVMAVCKAHDLPILIHTNEPVGHSYPGKTPNTLAQIYAMIKRFRDNTIVLAHWGGGLFMYNMLKKEVNDVLRNVYFDTAASPFLYDASVYRYAKELIGIEKILFGTDYPLLKPERYIKEMDAAGLSEREKTMICGENAARLLGIGK